MRCPTCRHDPPAGSGFCNRCGASLAAPVAAGSGDRRQITVMFCDIVGSTELAEALDAEELRLVVREYQQTAARIIHAYEGHVAQYLGDGLMVYFGYPLAHEDDAFRALSAALRILAGLPALNRELARRLALKTQLELEVRVGIHSGPALLSDMGLGDEQQRLALGETPNIAARLQSEAASGTILISEATRRLVQGAFVLDDLGRRRLKGVSEPIATYRVLSASGAVTRMERSAQRGLTPLIGREQEVALAIERWQRAVDGRGQTILLSGEPGIGKSRLVEVIREHVADQPHTWVEARCSPYHENSAFHPVLQSLERAFGIEEDQPESERRAALEAGLRDAGLAARHLASLVDLVAAPDGTSGASARDRRSETLEAFAAWLARLAAERPVVAVVEDLHWVDPSTLELLGFLMARVPRERMLLVLTFRPDFEVPWDPGPHLLRIGLHPLTSEQIVALCAAVAGQRRLPQAVLDELAARADGVPFFAEELTRAVIESEWRPDRDGAAIPSTLQETLMSRLDRLGSTRELAQLCGVVGREISYDLLRAVSPLRERELREGLSRLVDADLLSREGPAHQTLYVFRHALIQETAYHSLLRSERQGHHARIARALEQQFPERAAASPEVVARHHESAGAFDDAVRCYARAARQAVERSAHAEALGHFENAISLIGRLPGGAERDRRELELQVALGTSIMIAKGQGHPGVRAAHERARDLADATADAPELFRALWGLSRFHQSQGDLRASHELGERMLELAGRAGDASLTRWAHLALGQALFWRGDPARALEELEATIALSEESVPSREVAIFGQEPALTSRSLAAPALWMLGRPDRALRRSRECVALGKKAGDPFTYAMALDWAAVVHQMRGERERTRELASLAIELSSERGFPLYRGFGRVMRGWAAIRGPEDAGGLAEIERGLDDLQAAGTGLGAPYVQALMAEAQWTLGRADDALLMVDTALALAERQHSHLWTAELLRLKGEILVGIDPAARERGGSLLRRAMETARGQGAPSLELRAAISHWRLLGERGDGARVRELVAGFEEGFDTRDLQDARALLSERC